MPVTFFVLFALFVLLYAVLFSIAQAWAVADEDIRIERTLLAALVMAGLLTLGYLLMFFQGRTPAAQDSRSILFAAGVSLVTTAVLFVVSWLRYDRAAVPTTWRLFPVNLALFFLLTALEYAVLILIALSNIH